VIITIATTAMRMIKIRRGPQVSPILPVTITVVEIVTSSAEEVVMILGVKLVIITVEEVVTSLVAAVVIVTAEELVMTMIPTMLVIIKAVTGIHSLAKDLNTHLITLSNATIVGNLGTFHVIAPINAQISAQR